MQIHFRFYLIMLTPSQFFRVQHLAVFLSSFLAPSSLPQHFLSTQHLDSTLCVPWWSFFITISPLLPLLVASVCAIRFSLHLVSNKTCYYFYAAHFLKSFCMWIRALSILCFVLMHVRMKALFVVLCENMKCVLSIVKFEILWFYNSKFRWTFK